MSAQPTIELPEIRTLNPQQQMAICCALCAKYLGSSGRKWGVLRHTAHQQTYGLQLWICEGACRPLRRGPS
ncbi:hypothetical protein AB0N62_44700 [Streptomyces sp. NPDC093982]|uniref:hypothetical protein n=1 Tax=Streptomyces sp. NPDC093982 TaxID=3155077 RepID=UPI0034463898